MQNLPHRNHGGNSGGELDGPDRPAPPHPTREEAAHLFATRHERWDWVNDVTPVHVHDSTRCAVCHRVTVDGGICLGCSTSNGPVYDADLWQQRDPKWLAILNDSEPMPEPPDDPDREMLADPIPENMPADEHTKDPDWEGDWWETLLPEDEYPDPPPALLLRTDSKAIIPSHGFVEIIGPRSSAKSWLAVLTTAAALHMGRRVAYFRSEGNRQQLQERLRICGVKPTILLDSDRFRSVPREKLSHFLAAHNGWADGGVVIIDTATNAGGATNDAAEGDTWLSWAVYTFTSRSDATLVVSIDHVTKRIPDDVLTINSRGTGAKGDASDFTLFCDSYKGKGKTLTSTCWNREQNGHVHLRIAKPDRHGHIAADDDTNLLATLHGYHDPALGLLRLTIDPPKADTDTDTEMADPKQVALTIVQDNDKITTRKLYAARPEGITEALMRSTVATLVDSGLVYTTEAKTAGYNTASRSKA